MATETDDLNPNVPLDAPEDETSLRDELESAFQAESTSDEAPTERDRDEHGRFVKSQEPKTAQEPAEGTAPRLPGGTPPVPDVVPPAPPPEPMKPPSSWRPEVREKWAQVPAEVQGEIHRREHELQHVLQQSAQARQFVDAFERTVSPYQVFIRAENSTPLQAMDNLMQTAALLRTGSPEQKVGVIGTIIKQWGIDVDGLDHWLAGNLGRRDAPIQNGQYHQQQQLMYDPRVDQILAYQQYQLQQQAQAEEHQLDEGLRAFAADPRHEFYEDVRATMADLIEMAGRQGKILPVEQAYARACQLDESVSKILSQRESARTTGSLSQAALRAKRAARSVKGDSTPSGATVPSDDSLRGALEAAFEANSER